VCEAAERGNVSTLPQIKTIIALDIANPQWKARPGWKNWTSDCHILSQGIEGNANTKDKTGYPACMNHTDR
jgi:hypothetical protein